MVIHDESVSVRREFISKVRRELHNQLHPPFGAPKFYAHLFSNGCSCTQGLDRLGAKGAFLTVELAGDLVSVLSDFG